jgi:hypothetical protein
MRRLLLLLALLPSLAFAQTRPIPSSVSSSVSASGVSTQPLTAPGFFPAAQDFIFYVDPTGSDSNNCTSASTPCLTLQAAIAKVPPQWSQKARVILAAGTYTISSAYSLRVGTPVGAGEPLVIQGAMEDSGLGERTISSVTTYGSGYVVTVTDNTLSPTLDQWEGYFLRMTSCAAGCTGMTRLIRGNSTGGQFDFLVGSTSTTTKPAAGDKFVIERPSTVITLSAAMTVSANGMGTGGSSSSTNLIFDQVRFGGSNVLRINGAYVQFRLTQVISTSQTGGISAQNGSAVIAGPVTSSIPSDIAADTLAYGASLYVSTPTAGTNNGGVWLLSSSLVGFLALRNAVVFAYSGLNGIPGSNVYLSNLSVKYGHVRMNDASTLSIAASSFGPIAQILYGSSSTYPCIDSGSYSTTVTKVDVSNCTGGGISINRGGYASVSTVTGTGNTGFGLRVTGNATVQESSTTIAGTTSEVFAGGQTTTHAAVAAGAPLIVAGHGTVTSGAATPGGMTVGGLKLGASGTNISNSIRCTATLATDEIPSCQSTVSDCYVTQLLTCTGAAVGGECSIGSPSTLEAGLVQGCAVAGADSVAVRTVNATKAAITPAGSQTMSVRVWNP